MRNLLIALLLGVLSVVGMADTKIEAKYADPVTLNGKYNRAGLSWEIERGEDKLSKYSLNFLSVVSVKNESLNSLFTFDDRTAYLGLALGVDVFEDKNNLVKFVVGYTANFGNPTRRIRDGDWGVGLSYRVRLNLSK